MKRTLIIDGQILQTSAWHRGMGKYTLQVMRQLNESTPADLRLVVLFNNALDGDATRYETIKYLCPRIEQVRYDLPIPTTGAKAEEYRETLERFLQTDFAGDDIQYLITSVFFFDFFAEFPVGCRRLMLFYDLTPLLFWKDLGGYFPPDLYMKRFQNVLEAECILAISETTRQDLIATLGLEPETVININGGFTKIAEVTKKPSNFSVPKGYILFPTGDLPHKNNDVAIKGFSKYYTNSKTKLPLLITSRFSEASKQRLLLISEDIIFTGNVSDEELEWLYEHASAVLFASKYEGLGLPVLDAVASQKPVIASRISVFEEMSREAFYYFNEADASALAVALHEAGTKKNFEQKLKHYSEIMQKYTWANTCNKILDAVLQKGETTNLTPATQKSKIAVACLHPGIAGQLGRVAEAMYQSVDREFTVDYYFDTNGYHYREMERPSFLEFIDNKPKDIMALNMDTYKKYDMVVYLLDSHSLPSRLVARACVLPGIAITGFNDGKINDHSKALKRLALENQVAVHELPEKTYGAYVALIRDIKAEIIGEGGHPTPARVLLHKWGLHRGIIRRLLRMARDND